MKKNDTKVKVLGAVAIAAGAAMIGRIIYDFKKIRQLTREDADLTEFEPETEAPETEAPAAEAPETETPAAEPAADAEAPAAAEEAPAAEKAE